MFQPRHRQGQAKRQRRLIHQPLALERLEDRTLLNAGSVGSTIDLSGLSVDPHHYSGTDILVRFQTPSGTHGTPSPILAGTTIGAQLPLVSGLYEVQLSPGVSVVRALAAYRAAHGVLDAEPDYALAVSQVPNDPLFRQQWDLHNTGQNGGTPGADVHAEQAWDITTGRPKIVVAVNDTGIDYNHPDLYLNIWLNQAEIPASRLSHLVDVDHDGYISFRDLNNRINWGRFKVNDVDHDGRITAADILAPMVRDKYGHDTGYGGWAYPGNTQDGDKAHPNDFIGWNFVNNTNNPFDDNGHGTHVSGTIGATGNNGVGVAGIDWNVQLMPIKFLGADGSGTISSFIAGLNYEVNHGAKTSNNSWEGAPYSPALYNAINNARLHGQIFVAAAGNEGANDDTTADYPASFTLDNIVTVAATDNHDHLASFSNWGPHRVDLAAPGVSILSTLPGNRYGYLSGTSMATPHVTGALALVWSLHSSWTYTQVINQVLNTVDKLPSLQGKVATGGRLDVAAAVGWNLSTPTTPHIVSATVSGSNSHSINGIWLTFSEAIDVSSFTADDVRLTGPTGQVIPVIVRVVAHSGDRQMALVFATQTTAGDYHLFIGSGIRDLMGNSLPPYQATYTLRGPQTFTNNTASAIPDAGWTVSTITVPQNLTIGQVQVRLSITHTDDSDLSIYLQAPNGTDIVLANRRRGTGQNFQNTLFTDKAGTSIVFGHAPFSGSYRPEVSLSHLNGKNAHGTWKLWVRDEAARHTGRLLNWSLLLTARNASAGIVRGSAL